MSDTGNSKNKRSQNVTLNRTTAPRGQECSIGYLVEMFNGILTGREHIPEDWLDGRVSLIEKPNSKKADLTTYRPITVSTVLYRIFTRMLAGRITEWMENDEILGEMQNGFRTDRRGDDNLFMLTSMIEICRRQSKGLITCYLDCTKAYDRIDRDHLWETLRDLGMEEGWSNLLKAIYTDN